jgi:hypothetical protein
MAKPSGFASFFLTKSDKPRVVVLVTVRQFH